MSQGGRHLFSSESVTEGHPDKVCDQISDAIRETPELMDKKSWNNVYINGTGRFEQGGPFADTGITGRKIIGGVAEPVSIMVDTFGTAKISEDTIKALVRAHFPQTPKGMIRHLNLLRPIFQQTAAYGHFGRYEDDFTWEKTDKAHELRKDAGLS